MSYQRFRPNARAAQLARTVATLASVAGDAPERGPTVWSRGRWERFRAPSERQARPATFATAATFAAEAPSSAHADVGTTAAGGIASIVDAYGRMFANCIFGAQGRQIRVVERFLGTDYRDAVQLGWSDIDLFGCYPEPAIAAVRYDAMGAITIAALTATSIVTVGRTEIRWANGLASRRPLPCRQALPVWAVFPPKVC